MLETTITACTLRHTEGWRDFVLSRSSSLLCVPGARRRTILVAIVESILIAFVFILLLLSVIVVIVAMLRELVCLSLLPDAKGFTSLGDVRNSILEG